MKFLVIGLILLGLVAATSVAVLTGSLRAAAMRKATITQVTNPEVKVVVAAKDIPALSMINEECLRSQTVEKKNAPEGHFSDPVQVLGRRVYADMVAGQAFTEAIFAQRGVGLALAAGVLKPGMRAFTISLRDYASMRGLLEPGCVVDVLASFTLPVSEKEKGQGVSTTLLKNIQVIAVEDNTVLTEPEDQKKNSSSQRSSRGFLVTLMVDPKQAEALQLAMRYGEVSLSLRNPFDEKPVDDNATLLSPGGIVGEAHILDPTLLKTQENGEDEKDASSERGEAAGEIIEEPVNAEVTSATPVDLRLWNVDIMRGSSLETRSFEMPNEELVEGISETRVMENL